MESVLLPCELKGNALRKVIREVTLLLNGDVLRGESDEDKRLKIYFDLTEDYPVKAFDCIPTLFFEFSIDPDRNYSSLGYTGLFTFGFLDEIRNVNFQQNEFLRSYRDVFVDKLNNCIKQYYP